ncbi:MAG: DUF2071 domain-containing protein [Phycisphaeraceae bacterium]
MRIPVLRGVIDRRILANYRVAPEAVAKMLPDPLEPKCVGDWAMAGICLIRLKSLRPKALPMTWGMRSENAAHRFAVTWREDGVRREGVYVRRRDTDSRLNALAGGRLFPGVQHHAHFDVAERDDAVDVAMKSDDGAVRLRVTGRMTQAWPSDSLFATVEEASRFFEQGSLGFSPGRGQRLDAMELCCHNWDVTPLEVQRAESSFFDDGDTFPQGSVYFDHALLMRGIKHEWHTRQALCCTIDG